MQKSSVRTILYRFLFLFIIVTLTACGEHAETFRFAFMTDIHVQPEKRAEEGFSSAIAAVNQIRPDFVLTGGDLIMDALGVGEGRADSLYDIYQKLITQFHMPVYNTIGNHEVFGLYEKSGIKPDHPAYGKQMFRNRLGNGRTYASFDHKGWHFILLDGIGFTPERKYYGHIDSLQLDWLREDLEKVDKNTPVVLSTHIPFFSVYGQMKNGPTYAMTQGSVITNALDVMKILEPYNLKIVLQGHLHILEEIHYGKTSFITGGAVSAAWWNVARDGFPEGFLVVSLEGSNFTWNYKTFGWKAQGPPKP